MADEAAGSRAAAGGPGGDLGQRRRRALGGLAVGLAAVDALPRRRWRCRSSPRRSGFPAGRPHPWRDAALCLLGRRCRRRPDRRLQPGRLRHPPGAVHAPARALLHGDFLLPHLRFYAVALMLDLAGDAAGPRARPLAPALAGPGRVRVLSRLLRAPITSTTGRRAGWRRWSSVSGCCRWRCRSGSSATPAWSTTGWPARCAAGWEPGLGGPGGAGLRRAAGGTGLMFDRHQAT